MKIWYAYNGKKFAGTNPPFYDLKGIPWYDKLNADLPGIREKVLAFLKKEGLNKQEYFHTDRVEGASWNIVSFMYWGLRNEKVINIGKDIFEYFNNIPGLISMTASILQPKTRIKGHDGDTDAIYRVHIPIYIPAQLPDCGLTVAGVTRPWMEDEITVFCDAYFHEAWNMTEEPRIVLIVDIVREEFLPQTEEITANVLSSILYEEFFFKYKFMNRLPAWLSKRIKKLFRRRIKDAKIFG